MAEAIDKLIERGASVDWMRVQAYACDLEYQAAMHLAQGRISQYVKAEQEMLSLEYYLEAKDLNNF